ncbi:MAG: S49 family peptidase [Arachnia sp.]
MNDATPAADPTPATPPPDTPLPPPQTAFAPPRWAAKPPSPFKRGFGQGAGLGLGLTAMVVVVGVVTGIFSLIALSMSLASMSNLAGASTVTSPIWGNPDASGKLRAISISGGIMADPSEGSLLAAGTYGYEVAEMLDELTAEDAAGVVLLVNTPGGSVVGSKAIADAVIRYQERTGNKVFVHVEGMSASGGVYATAPADQIVADYGSTVGSIGVIVGPFARYTDPVAIGSTMLEPGVTTTGGITESSITAGTGKDVGNPYRDMTEAEHQMLQNLVDSEYELFVTHMETHREIPRETIVNEMGAGLFSNEDAQRLGLIDAVMGRDEFFRSAAESSGLDPDDTVVETVLPPTGFLSMLGVDRAAGASLPAAALEGGALTVSQDFCGTSQPLTFAGDLTAVCGR